MPRKNDHGSRPAARTAGPARAEVPRFGNGCPSRAAAVAACSTLAGSKEATTCWGSGSLTPPAFQMLRFDKVSRHWLARALSNVCAAKSSPQQQRSQAVLTSVLRNVPTRGSAKQIIYESEEPGRVRLGPRVASAWHQYQPGAVGLGQRGGVRLRSELVMLGVDDRHRSRNLRQHVFKV